MTDKQVDILAEKIADLLYEKVKLLFDGHDFTIEVYDEDQEQVLLAELAKAMTLLDSYLKAEQYDKCAIIQNKIKRIENKLKKL